MTARRPQAGLTLVELMIAMAIASIAMGAALAVGLTMGTQYRDHREIAQTERAARIALELIADGIRGAGPGVPSARVYVQPGCVQMGSIRVEDSSTSSYTYEGAPLSPRSGTDVLEMVQPAGGTYSTLRQPFDETTTSLGVTNSAGWRAGDFALVTNLGTGANSVGYVVEVSATPTTTDAIPITALNSCPFTVSPPIGAGGFAIRVRPVRYFVADLGANAPFLMVDLDLDKTMGLEPQPVAPGVEDLQIAVAVEDLTDGDTIITPDTVPSDADEWFGNFATDVPVTNIAQFPGDPVAAPWRALRVSIVARALDPATEVATNSFFAVDLENHDVANTPDIYRRRVLQTTVDVRNLEGSP